MSELPPRKRRKRKPGTAAKKKIQQRDRDDSVADSDGDALGRLIEKYEVTLAGVVVVCTVLLVVGAAVLGWGYLQNPGTRTSLTAMIIGGFIVLMGLVLFGFNILNIGRSLELRKRGIRFRERGQTSEMLWSEIAHVEVDRLDATNLGSPPVILVAMMRPPFPGR